MHITSYILVFDYSHIQFIGLLLVNSFSSIIGNKISSWLRPVVSKTIIVLSFYPKLNFNPLKFIYNSLIIPVLLVNESIFYNYAKLA